MQKALMLSRQVLLEKRKIKTTVLMKYVKLGWRMRGEANETKSNQKSIEPNRSDCYSIGSVIEHNRIGTSLELFGEFT